MTHKNPLVSVGMPVYNAESEIEKALDSILAQTYPNLEIVICDNASTDRTPEICRGYATRFPGQIRFFRNRTNLGRPPNFRRVLNLARGEFFMWAASDDVRPPNAVKACVEAIQRNRRAVLAHGPVVLEAEGRSELVQVDNDVDLSQSRPGSRIRAFTDGISQRAIFYGVHRRSALRRTHYRRGYGADYLLCLQMCLLGPIAYTPEPMIVYRERFTVPCLTPMPPATRLTPMTLLKAGRSRIKHWAALLGGGFFLWKVRGVDRRARLEAVWAHLSAFTRRYYSQLLKDSVLLLFWPLARFWKLILQSLRVAGPLRFLVTRR